MYKKQYLHCVVPSLKGLDLDGRKKYLPMSYYIFGGLDLDGDALDINAPTTFDSKDDTGTIDCTVDATSNPRVSAFDIAEQIGISALEKYRIEQAQQQAAEPTETD